MIKRINKKNNRKREFKSIPDQTTSRCPQGYTWVTTYIRRGRIVKGHCKKNTSNHIVQVTRENGITYGWNRGPVYVKENRVIETSEKFNNALESEQ